MASSDKFKDCECEATLFFQKYKERIFQRLETISGFDAEQEDYANYDDLSKIKSESDKKQYHVRINKKLQRIPPSKFNIKGKHSKQKLKSKKDQETAETKYLDEEDGKDQYVKDKDGKYIEGKDEAGKYIDRKDKDGKHRKDKIKYDKDKGYKEENISQIGSETLSSRSEKTITSSEFRTGNDLESNLQQEERYLQIALDSRIQEIFGEEMEESMKTSTERGYYIFERSDQSTVQKMPSIFTSSGEEEAEETYLKPKIKAEIEWMSDTERKANEYLKTHKIWDLFNFMGSHLVSANPCNPIDFLINLLDNCLKYRKGYGDPPLLFLPKHIESLFNSMDPMKTGFIEIHQYHTGMYTLGIKEYDMFPKIVHSNLVHKEFFVHEACFQLKIQLDEMIHNFATPFTISTISSLFTEHEGGG